MKLRIGPVAGLALVVLLAACGSDEGKTIATGDVADAGVPGDGHILFPSDKGSVDGPLDAGGEQPFVRNTDAWDFFVSTDAEVVEGDDAWVEGDVTLVCSKDSDCDGKPLGLSPCSRAVCDKHLGQCIPGPRAPGEVCDDEDACTVNTTCTGNGTCAGAHVVCDDGNICTTDSCDSEKGCMFAPNDNVCDDGNACTKNDRCESGNCVGESGDACACTKDEDCASFEDGDLCNGEVKCIFSLCKVPQSTIITCPDPAADNPCVKTVCQPETGECVQFVRENGRPCDDGDACTLGDLCLQGKCVGSAPLSCDDDNSCTNDTCNAAGGCLHEHSLYPCEDGDACTVNDHCKFGFCIPGAANLCESATCFPKWPLLCGAVDAWATAGQGSTDNVSAYSCGGGEMAGPEYTYAFVAPFDGAASIALAPGTTGTKVFLLEGKGTGCDATNCRTFSEGVLNFDMFKGANYFVVIDGPDETGDDYTIQMDCAPHEEFLCGDGEDGDQDGLIDCDDIDCKGSLDCPEPLCTPIWTLGCGATDFGANYGLGSANSIVTYSSVEDNKGCLDNQWIYSGPELAYRFDAPGSFDVTVKLVGETAQTDLLILRDDGHGCDPVDCIAWGLKKVTFPAEAGKTYFFVVDGYSGAQGEFDVEVSCPQFVETNCTDDEDNDLDTLTDCEDSDCYQAVECVGFCQPARTIGCGFSEAFANFGWGSTKAIPEYSCKQYDYSGPEMAYRFKAPYDTAVKATLQLESASTDILVVQGYACDPTNCAGHGLDSVTFDAAEGVTYNIIVDGYQGGLGTYVFNLACSPDSEVDCADGVDNDADGQTDCADEADCNLSGKCAKCQALYTLTCGDVDEWSTDSEDATDQLPAYSCAAGLYDGPEFAYLFQAQETSEVALSLSSTGWDLDLFVLQDNGYGCNPANCIAWGTNHASFVAEKDVKYYFVVDGYGKAPAGFGPGFGLGDYVLTVECP